MNRAPSLAFRVAIAAIFLVSGTCRMKAQEPASTPSKQETPSRKPPSKIRPKKKPRRSRRRKRIPLRQSRLRLSRRA